MQKSYAHVKVLSFFIVMHIGIVQTMEFLSQVPIENREALCAELAKSNVEMLNFMNELLSLPIKYAVDAIVSRDNDWMARDENRVSLIRLVKVNTLQDDVASAVVEKLQDVVLARQFAKEGEITNGVASLIVNDFLKTDIVDCLSDFDGFFLKAFPEKIFAYGNYDLLYKKLMSAVTKNYLFIVVDTINKSFSEHDFNMSMSFAKDYGTGSQMGCAITDPEENFHVKCENKNFLRIANLKTKIALNIVVPVKVAQLALKKDNVLSLGMLDTDGKIHELVIPETLLQREIPLQQVAALVYCKMQTCRKTMKSMDCMGYTIFDSQDCNGEMTLIKFIQEKLQDNWIPLCLRNAIIRDCQRLNEVVALRKVFDDIAQTLSVTRKQVAIDLYVHNDEIVWSVFNKKYPDWSTQSLVQGFERTFIDYLYEPQ